MQYISNLNDRQKFLIDLYASIFNIKDARGNLKSFIPTLFQQEFLKDSLLCNDKYFNRIVNKGRGIGFTALIAGELLIAAASMPGITIPIASISSRNVNILINWCIFLADNSNEIEGYSKIERDQKITSVVRLKNGSEIIPISGGNPESIRGFRSPLIVMDEFAFQDYQKQILSAGERCASEGGQISIISTPRTTDVINDEYWRIWVRAEELQYKNYRFPIFENCNPEKPLPEQNLIPLAPWLNMEQLEKDRRRDPLSFSRENLCLPVDESVAFLPWGLVKKCCILQPRKPFVDAPVFAGIDVGRVRDLTAIEIFQLVDGRYYHIHEKILKSVPIPQQVEEIKDLNSIYNFTKMYIDKTGIGLGLFEYAKKDIGAKVKGINFTKDLKVKIANNMRNMMQDDKLYLLKIDALMDDIHSVPYDTLNAPRTADGHSDRFWGCALGVMKLSGRFIDAGGLLDGYL